MEWSTPACSMPFAFARALLCARVLRYITDAMDTKSAVDVARRSLCLELLLQRLGLETDTEDSPKQRDDVRLTWLSRLTDLGVDETVLEDERALLERPVGALSEDELDDLHGRASGSLVLLWALGRLEVRPSFATVDAMESVLAEHGVLGDGSIAKANTTVSSAQLRSEDELKSALALYERTRGKAREPSEPEKIVAGVAAHHLMWILERDMPFHLDS